MLGSGRPGKTGSGFDIYDINLPLQLLSKALIHLERNPNDEALSALRFGWRSGTVTAKADYFSEKDVEFTVACGATRAGYTAYKRGLTKSLPSEHGPPSASGAAGVAAVMLYNDHTRHGGLAVERSRPFASIGTCRKTKPERRRRGNEGNAADSAAHGVRDKHR